MTPNELEKYLHNHFPLSRAMQVSVVNLDENSVVLGAPLEPNTNHCGTVFGASASTLAILAAWSLVYLHLRDAGIDSQLVIQRNSMEYAQPITGAFTAKSSLTPSSDWNKFLPMLTRKGKARISVSSELKLEDKIVGCFIGEFVALNKSDI